MDTKLIELTRALEKELDKLKEIRKTEEKAFAELKAYLGMHKELGNRDAALSEAREQLGKAVISEHYAKER